MSANPAAQWLKEPENWVKCVSCGEEYVRLWPSGKCIVCEPFKATQTPAQKKKTQLEQFEDVWKDAEPQ